jgi:hypothetical protein
MSMTDAPLRAVDESLLMLHCGCTQVRHAEMHQQRIARC